ncbi:MAG: L-threonine 3-dehydrogenase, partial [Oscillospiraceae bacterium]
IESALNQMIDNLYNGGKIAMWGIPSKNTKIDWNKVVFNGLFIKGIYGREMFDTWYKMGAMLQGGLDISKIITHRFDVRDYEKGFEAMISGNSGKVVLDWTKLHD